MCIRPVLPEGLQIIRFTNSQIIMWCNKHSVTLSLLRRDSRIAFTKLWIISVGFWRWCISIERIVLLDFFHRLVSQKNWIKIYIPKNHNTHVQNSHEGQLLTTEQLTWVHTQHKPLKQVRHRWQQMTQPLHTSQLLKPGKHKYRCGILPKHNADI
jgi:hypothetical protein